MSASTDSSQSNAAETRNRQFNLRFVFAVVTAAAVACGLLRWFGLPDIDAATFIAIAATVLGLQLAALGTIIKQSRGVATPAVCIGLFSGGAICIIACDSHDELWFWLPFWSSLSGWYTGGFFAALDDRTRFLRYAFPLAVLWTLLLLTTFVTLGGIATVWNYAIDAIS